ncbi:MAG: acetyl-CoA carboxylase, carboxyltransferase subunit beta [bacterium]|nr:acetyl-CoA carboxylase, carboxyltransferase subunit beta [bacterium]
MKRPKYSSTGLESSHLRVPDGLMTKCPGCEDVIYNKELEKNHKVCPKCSHHFRLSARERLDITIDAGSFEEYDSDMSSANPLDFPEYESKLAKSMSKTGQTDAVITGQATVAGYKTVIAVTDFAFMGGSMGSVVGEKIVTAMERAIELRLPVLVISASGGGARMQEGILSLMQMAKTSAAAARLREAGLPYIVVLTDPTMGGVAASFASLGDVIMAEPGALIGFAGPRVIEQTIRQKLPEGFQRAEFQLEHGFVDIIVMRKDIVATISTLYSFYLD